LPCSYRIAAIALQQELRGSQRRTRSAGTEKQEEKESAYKPGSVEGNHSSGIRVTADL
jgi:hypothetical protein